MAARKFRVKLMNGSIEEMTAAELRSFGPLLSEMQVEVGDPGEEYWTRATHAAPASIVVSDDGLRARIG